MIDVVHAELDARVDTLIADDADRARTRNVVKRLLVWEHAVDARGDGTLALTLESERASHAALFRRVDEILEVPRAPWWSCGGGRRRVYAGFHDDDLMAALKTAVLE